MSATYLARIFFFFHFDMIRGRGHILQTAIAPMLNYAFSVKQNEKILRRSYRSEPILQITIFCVTPIVALYEFQGGNSTDKQPS